MKKYFLCVTMMMAALTVHAVEEKTVQENQNLLQESAAAGEDWLKEVDRERYAESWSTAAATLQLRISKDSWVLILQQMREPLGEVISRKLIDQRTAEDPQGLPPGNYMVLFYESAFTNRKSAKELLTLVQESDGKWRVLSYHVS